MRRAIAFVCCTALFGCNDGAPKPSGAAGSTAVAPSPAATVTIEPADYEQLQRLIAEKRGRFVVLDVWSTYCEPCMQEFPGLVALHRRYGAERVACISLCANFTGLGKPEDDRAAALEFLRVQGATFDNRLSTVADAQLYAALGIATVPAVFVYDRDGRLVKKFDGEVKYADVDALLAPRLR